jgi:hypothetical protein
VVAFGTDFVNLLPQLKMEREVTLAGWLRSRDIDTDGRRVVTEIVAHEIVPVKMRVDALCENGSACRLPELIDSAYCRGKS